MSDRQTNRPGAKRGGNTGKENRPSEAELIRAARAQLEPLLLAILDALAADAQSPASGTAEPDAGPGAMASGTFFAAGEFVQNLLVRLKSLKDEEALLHLLLDISLIGFQGFECSERSAQAIEALLNTCESIAHTMTADDRGPH